MKSDILPVKRKQWVDYVRGISMLLVILYHAEYIYPVASFDICRLFSSFFLASFFIISGYLFTSDYKTFSLGKKLKSIFRGIVWPYLVFTLIIWIPKAFFNGTTVLQGLRDIALGWASWFVVALAVGELMFALCLKYTKNLKIIIAFAVFSLFIGYIIKEIYPMRLPYYIDRAFIVIVFLVIGFLYRIYEDKIHQLIKINYYSFLSFLLLYALLEYLDYKYLHIADNFHTLEYNHYLLFYIYAVVGTMMVILFARVVSTSRFLCFVGQNSLVFYFLNSGGMKLLTLPINKLLACLPENIVGNLGGLKIILLVVCVCMCITPIVWLIERYCPIIIGDKASFNTLAKKLHMKISF